MELTVYRKWNRPTYCIGRLYVDGEYVCDTLEPHCIDWEKEIKKDGCTAIPEGTYGIDMTTVSAAFGHKSPYRTLCHGCPPRLTGTTTHQGVLIHCGNTADDTRGCLLVGRNDTVGAVSHSRETFIILYKMMRAAYDNGEQIHITYIKQYWT